MTKKKLLILTPSFDLIGGVANHYLGLNKHWKEDVKYHFYGKRKKLPAIVTFGFDLLSFIFKLIFCKPDVVIVNPSLRTYQLIRDGIYLLIAKRLRIEVIVFFHGWDERCALKLKNKSLLFNFTYDKSLLIYVLASSFKKQLLEIGINDNIKITTTKVSDNLLSNFKIESRTGKIDSILFLARIKRSKGIFIVLNSFEIIQKQFPHLNLVIVGDGSDINEVKEQVFKLKLNNISFRGELFGEQIAYEFKKSQLYILPSYSEGMPTSVLEAMAFGMPIITTPVGGLNDFFEQDLMGTLVNSFDPNKFAIEIEKYLRDSELTRKVSYYNHKYAKKRFMASKVARNMEYDINRALI